MGSPVPVTLSEREAAIFRAGVATGGGQALEKVSLRIGELASVTPFEGVGKLQPTNDTRSKFVKRALDLSHAVLEEARQLSTEASVILVQLPAPDSFVARAQRALKAAVEAWG